MYTTVGNVQERSPNRLPNAPINREHPEGQMRHANGRVKSIHMIDGAIRNNDRVIITVDGPCVGAVVGESAKVARESLTSVRSMLAKAGSTSHTQRFVHTQKGTDSRLDNPYTSTLTLAPARNGRTRGMGGRSGGIARRAS
jgi:hypothetical protein